MVIHIFLPLIFVALHSADCHKINIVNGCPFTVWIGVLNNPGKELPVEGGFKLDSSGSRSFDVSVGWAGRVWPRTRCDDSGKCQTGDCGGKIECKGAGGVPPVSLAEFTFDGSDGLDFYDVSLVDGYNLPISISPIAGTFVTRDNGKYDCKRAGCNKDLNAICPAELAIKSGESTVACKSACLAFNSDEYCCRGEHNKPETCRSSQWPTNYPAKFKEACPDAYSYAYDDQSSTFTCKGKAADSTGYDIKFCP